MYRPGWIDVLGAHLGAFTNEGASPNAFFGAKDVLAFGGPLIALVKVVPVRQRDRRRAEEVRIAVELRTGCITQQAVDAH